MAIIPSTLYSGQVDTSDATGYPLGKAKNELVEGDNTGTPLEASWISDVWGFLQALLAQGAVTANGNPDKVGASQYLDAIQKAPWAWSGQHTFALKDYNYSTPRPFSQIIPLASGLVVDGSDVAWDAGNWKWKFDAGSNGNYVTFPLAQIPSAAVISDVKLLLNGTTSHTFSSALKRISVSTNLGGRSSVQYLRLSTDVPLPSSGDQAVTLLTPGGAASSTIDRSGFDYLVDVTVKDPSVAGASALLGIEVFYMMPGYRNG